jgi:hypothetical protein
MRNVSFSIGPRKGTTGTGNRPKTFVALVYVGHIEDTTTMCETSIVNCSNTPTWTRGIVLEELNDLLVSIPGGFEITLRGAHWHILLPSLNRSFEPTLTIYLNSTDVQLARVYH